MVDIENIRYLTSYETENSLLDFKGAQYKTKQFHDFIKDICAFANSRSTEEKYIIIGVFFQPDGTRAFRNILEEEVIDQSVFQQLIIEHIYPDIHFEMIPFEHEGYQLACFRIFDCNERPYLIKKEYNSSKGDKVKALCLGQGWIRKGDTNFSLQRDDLEEIYAQRYKEKNKFSDRVTLFFSETECSEITLNPIVVHELPSGVAKSRIETILQKREEEESKKKVQPLYLSKIVQSPLIDAISQISPPNLSNAYRSLGMSIPYEERSNKELKELLAKIRKIYRKDDIYELFQNHAYRLNLFIENSGPTFLKNITIIFRIPVREGLCFFLEEPEEPNANKYPMIRPILGKKTYFYPNISESNNSYTIEHQLKQVRHNISEEVFRVTPRFLINNKISPVPITINWELHAENNPEPIIGILHIKISKEEVILTNESPGG